MRVQRLLQLFCDMDMAITIRTMMSRDRCLFAGGGGLVADSVPRTSIRSASTGPPSSAPSSWQKPG